MYTRWIIKGCPKCGGSLYLDNRENTKAWVCINCGYTKHLIKEWIPEKIHGLKIH